VFSLLFTKAKVTPHVQPQTMEINCGAQRQTIMIKIENGETAGALRVCINPMVYSQT
jgi:hypothetical protein